MSRKVIAVGGTGQVVLHHYLQLYLLGVLNDRFDAVVIDTDEVFKGLEAIREFLELAQFGRDSTAGFGTDLPSLKSLRTPTPEGQNLAEVLTGNATLSASEMHPARAFFSEETLKLDLIKGLFARPAMSSAMEQEHLRADALRPAFGTNNVIVGSLIGGTGGGLSTPLVDIVRSYQAAEDIGGVKLRGVFFGQYFVPEEGRLEAGVARFRSNELLVLKTMADQLEVLHSFYLVRPEQRVERDPESEKRSYAPWPKTDSHPLWQGVQALDFLLSESTKEKSMEFTGKEFSEAQLPSRPTLKQGRERLEQVVALIDRFVDFEVVRRIEKENWIETVWGSGLTRLIALFWRSAIEHEGRDRALGQFTSQVQGELERLWRGEEGSYGLREAFPEPDHDRRIRPKHIRMVPWPRDDQDTMRHRDLFEGSGVSARRLAATLLFWLLRRGELR